MKLNFRDDRLWLVLFVLALALVSSMHWRFPHQAGGFTPIAQRHPATGMILPQLDGGEWRLADHPGQVVLVNYWATWCEPCREELPGLAAVAKQYAPRGLTVVGISMDEGGDVPARVREFARKIGMPYTIAFPAATRQLGPREISIPISVLIDRHGRIVKTYNGAVERADFAQDVDALLKET